MSEQDGTQGVRVRSASFADAADIFTLVRSHPEQLVPRSKSDILLNIDRFLVAECGGRVVGVVSWGVLPELGSAKHPSVEVKSLAVEAPLRGRRVGRQLVEAVLARIAELRPEQAIALTFEPEFFRRFGFREVPKERLMHKLYTGCVNCTRYDNPFTCPEIAMAKEMNPPGAVDGPAPPG